MREITEDEAEAFNRAYQHGCDLIQGEMITPDAGQWIRPRWFARRRLKKGIAALESALSVIPESWQAHWFQGKGYQTLGDHSRALACFGRAFEIEPGQPDVAREALIAALESGEPAQAVRFGEAAVAASPADAGHVANLALALLVSGDTAAAVARASEAVASDPTDRISQRVMRAANDVAAGRRSPPTKGSDL